jgi:hypothetical protein
MRLFFVLLLSAANAMAAESLPIDAIPKDAVLPPVSVFNFDQDALGKPPARFVFAVAQEGPEVHWEVKQEPHAPSPPNVLVQSGRARPGDNFALALLDGVRMDHGEAAVKFKAISGDQAQSAGVVWRYKDPQNFYLAEASAKDDNCSVYRVKKGKCKLLGTQAIIVSPFAWHEIRAVFVDDDYTVLLDGQLAVGGKDSGLKGAGLVGLSTHSDSVMAFDDFHVSQ